MWFCVQSVSHFLDKWSLLLYTDVVLYAAGVFSYLSFCFSLLIFSTDSVHLFMLSRTAHMPDEGRFIMSWRLQGCSALYCTKSNLVTPPFVWCVFWILSWFMGRFFIFILCQISNFLHIITSWLLRRVFDKLLLTAKLFIMFLLIVSQWSLVSLMHIYIICTIWELHVIKNESLWAPHPLSKNRNKTWLWAVPNYDL